MIVGGESGPGARPMHLAWAQELRDRCAEASVDFFFKQWGGVVKKRTGRALDGRTHDAMPALSTSPIPDRKVRAAFEEDLQMRAAVLFTHQARQVVPLLRVRRRSVRATAARA